MISFVTHISETLFYSFLVLTTFIKSNYYAYDNIKFEQPVDLISKVDCHCNHIFHRLTRPECWQFCPKRVSNESRPLLIEKFLRNDLFGQDETTTQIVSIFRMHRYDRPLSIHFIGLNGVGKTMAADLISSSIFLCKPHSSLYIRGNSYRSALPSSIERYRDEIRFNILSYLAGCPQGVVIVDELETIHRDTASIFEELLDFTMGTTYTAKLDQKEVTANTKEATFILISDFGSEEITKDMTKEQVVQKANEDIFNSWQSYKQGALIQHTAHFQRLNKEGVKNMITKLLINFHLHPTFGYSKLQVRPLQLKPSKEILISKISRNIYDEVLMHLPRENYRGVDKMFDIKVASKIVEAINKYNGFQREITIQLEFLEQLAVKIIPSQAKAEL